MLRVRRGDEKTCAIMQLIRPLYICNMSLLQICKMLHLSLFSAISAMLAGVARQRKIGAGKYGQCYVNYFASSSALPS